MKKLLLLSLVGVVGFGVWRRVEEDRQDRDLWASITDTVD